MEKKKGFCENLILSCKSCKAIVKTFNTSATVDNIVRENNYNRVVDVNLLSVVAITSN